MSDTSPRRRPFARLIGEIRYQPPAWAGRLDARHRRAMRWLAVLAALAVVVAGVAWIIVRQLPQPAVWLAEVTPPPVAAVPEDGSPPVPQPLTITFTYRPASDAPTGVTPPVSPAPLERIGGEAGAAVSLHPALPGTWRWAGERTLRFEPEAAWPADTDYEIRVGRAALAEGARLQSDRLSMRTPAFSASLANLEFGADASDPRLRFASARIEFSHPVDSDSLKSKLRLHWQAGSEGVGAGDIPVVLSYDEFRRIAFLRSEPIELPPQDTTLEVTLEAGLSTTAGGAKTAESGTVGIVVPSASHAFRLDDAETAIVRDESDTPFQTLILEFTEAVDMAALRDRLEVYLLPRRDRDGKPVADGTPEASRAYNRWRTVGALSPATRDMARRLEVTFTPGERPVQTTQSLRFETPDDRELYLRVRPGLEAASGLTTGEAIEAVVSARNYPREARLIGDGGLLARSGDRRLSFVSRGVSALRVEVGRVSNRDLHHLVSQTRGEVSRPDFTSWNFDRDNLTERERTVIPLAPGGDREAKYASIDLSDFTAGQPLGLFFVSVEGWDVAGNRPVGVGEQRLVLLSDLGLLVKTTGSDGGRELFVMDVGDGRPVGGAEVALLGLNGVAVARRRTDGAGHATFGDLSGLGEEREPTVFVVRSGADVAFIPYQRRDRGLNYSRFDVGGEYTRYGNPDGLSAFPFTDRGLYRPGETVHLAYIVKRRDFAPAPDLPLEISVTDPSGRPFFERRVTLDPAGFDALDIPTLPQSETGRYGVNVALIRGRDGERREVIGNGGFQVQEFQPDRLKVRARIAGAEGRAWLAPGDLRLDVNVDNLFGTPAEDRAVSAKAIVQPALLRFDDYPGYRFIDPLRDEDSFRSETIELPDARTNADGLAQFTLNLARYAAGIYRVTTQVEGYEEAGGRGVTASDSVMLSPLDAVVGWKADGDLSYLRQGSAAAVRLVALGVDEQPRAMPKLVARRMQRVQQSSLVRGSDGRYRYQSLPQLVPVGEPVEAPLPTSGLDYALTTDTAGDYVVEFVDPTGLVRARVEYFVAGSGDLSAGLERGSELELSLDRSDYAPGDSIELAMVAPFAGAGLITIETDHVVASRWFRSETPASVQRIRVPEDLDGSAYVNVAFVRALDAPDIYTAPLSYAVAPITVGRSRRTLPVSLDVVERMRPGETLEIEYAAEEPARMAVFAVDEGILQVAGYDTPAPLDHFLRKRALEVETLQTVDLLLPEFRLLKQIAGVGGGNAAKAALLRNLNPFARKTDAPAVYWLGVVDAGPQPRTARYVVPDHFNGQLRVMAVAVSDSAMGADSESVTVRAPIVVTPNLPTMAAPGDEFEVVVGVSNGVDGSGAQAEIGLTLEPGEQLEIVGESSTTLTIGENREGNARFRVRALPFFGSASLQFRATLGDVSQTRTATLSVRPAVAYADNVTLGSVDAGTHRLEMPRDLLPVHASASLRASHSPVLLADGLVDYLAGYPFSCTEQLVSAAWPSLVAGSADRVDTLVAALRLRQQNDGGFTLWPGGSGSDVDASLHALHFLRDALDAGRLPGDAQGLLSRGQSYLRRRANTPVDTLADARRRAYAIYLLTRGGEVTGNQVLDLQQWLGRQDDSLWRGDVTAVWLAGALALLQSTPEAERLLRGYRLGRQSLDQPGPYDSVLAQDAQFIDVVSRNVPGLRAEVDADDLKHLLTPVLNQGYNSYSAAFAVMALHAVGESAGGEPVRAEVLNASGATTALPLEPGAATPLPADAPAVRLTSDATAYYALRQAGFDAGLPDAARADGLEITREFLAPDEDVAARPRVGEDLRVRLRLRSTDGALHQHVAVIDLLPAGFEVDVDSLEAWQQGHVEVREDRVLWFGPVDGGVTELVYRARPTAVGEFVVPPASAQSMYRRDVHGSTAAGRVGIAGR